MQPGFSPVEIGRSLDSACFFGFFPEEALYTSVYFSVSMQKEYTPKNLERKNARKK
jgi:hypothetical protein